MVCHFSTLYLFLPYIFYNKHFFLVFYNIDFAKHKNGRLDRKRQVDLIITALMFQEIRTPFTIKFLCKNFRISEKSSTLAWFFTNHRMYN